MSGAGRWSLLCANLWLAGCPADRSLQAPPVPMLDGGNPADGGDAGGDGAVVDPPAVVPSEGVQAGLEQAPGEDFSTSVAPGHEGGTLMLSVQPRDPETVVRLLELGSGAGPLFQHLDDELPFAPNLEFGREPGLTYSIMLPNAPGEISWSSPVVARLRLGVRDGIYVFVPHERAVLADVRWSSTPVPEADTELLLPVVVFVAPDLSRSPEEVATGEAWQAIRAEVEQILAVAGIVPLLSVQPLGGLLSQVADEQDFRQVLQTARGALQSPALPVVVVGALQTASSSVALGKTSAVPGPVIRPEQPFTGGVVLPLWSRFDDGVATGRTLAHELCHYLGLSHTSEPSGVDHDPLPDTPECPVEFATQMDDRGRRFVGYEDCIGFGADNLMFFESATDDGPQRTLSEDQRWVLRRHPLLQL